MENTRFHWGAPLFKGNNSTASAHGRDVGSRTRTHTKSTFTCRPVHAPLGTAASWRESTGRRLSDVTPGNVEGEEIDAGGMSQDSIRGRRLDQHAANRHENGAKGRAVLVVTSKHSRQVAVLHL